MREEAEAKRRELETANLLGGVEEAYEIIGNLDNALKAFTGALGLEVRRWERCVCISS